MSEHRVFGKIAEDVASIARKEGRAHASLLMLLRLALLTPGFQFVLMVRLQELVSKLPLLGPFLAAVIWWFASTVFRCDVGLECRIGAGLYVPHPYGIVIKNCVLGNNVVVLQNVTISGDDPNGLIVADSAYFGAGAVVTGAITIGQGAIVGANAVVQEDVPQWCTVVGNPARVISRRTP